MPQPSSPRNALFPAVMCHKNSSCQRDRGTDGIHQNHLYSLAKIRQHQHRKTPDSGRSVLQRRPAESPCRSFFQILLPGCLLVSRLCCHRPRRCLLIRLLRISRLRCLRCRPRHCLIPRLCRCPRLSIRRPSIPPPSASPLTVSRPFTVCLCRDHCAQRRRLSSQRIHFPLHLINLHPCKIVPRSPDRQASGNSLNRLCSSKSRFSHSTNCSSINSSFLSCHLVLCHSFVTYPHLKHKNCPRGRFLEKLFYH